MQKDVLDLDRLIYEGNVKLEITGGIPTWEVYPGTRHQRVRYLIQTSIKPSPESDMGRMCENTADTYIRFTDGSLKRPDIAIFSVQLPIQDEALTIIPQAVVEISNPGYEYKDVELNPPFYLSQGVEDVVIVDPRAGIVTHHRATEVITYHTPVTIALQCGCECSVPQVGEAS